MLRMLQGADYDRFRSPFDMRDDMPQHPTYSGYVPVWEIDANGHWSTEFYIRAFQQASERFLTTEEQGTPGAASAIVRHVRLFRELRALEAMEITSSWLPDGFGEYRTVHVMRNVATNAISACAFDQPLQLLRKVAQGQDENLDKLMPRGLPSGLQAAEDTAALISAKRACISHIGVLRPASFDHTGALTGGAIHGCLSDGTGHLWQFLGIGPRDFYDNGLGRANVEIKVSRLSEAASPGQAIRLVSWFAGLSSKTFHLRHQIEDLLTGMPLAAISVVSLALDLKARRAVALPEGLRRRLLEAGS
jgi:acyl-CoA thioesterase FadM